MVEEIKWHESTRTSVVLSSNAVQATCVQTKFCVSLSFCLLYQTSTHFNSIGILWWEMNIQTRIAIMLGGWICLNNELCMVGRLACAISGWSYCFGALTSMKKFSFEGEWKSSCWVYSPWLFTGQLVASHIMNTTLITGPCSCPVHPSAVILWLVVYNTNLNVLFFLSEVGGYLTV